MNYVKETETPAYNSMTNQSISSSSGAQKINRESRKTVGKLTIDEPRIICKNVNVFYGEKQAINDLSMEIGNQEVISFIGPSGCGKSTFLRTLNRMNDTIVGCRVEGEIKIDEKNIYDKTLDVVPLRAMVGHGVPKAESVPEIHL